MSGAARKRERHRRVRHQGDWAQDRGRESIPNKVYGYLPVRGMGSLLRPARPGWHHGGRPKGEFLSAQHEATLMSQNPRPPNEPALPAPAAADAARPPLASADSPDGPLVDVSRLQEAIALFARERDWDPFHSPKNLAMALTAEVGELVELFQWLSEGASRSVAQDPATARRVRDEIADVLVYVVRLAAVLGVDLDEAVRSKLAANALKYPADRARGNAKKYSDL